MAIELKPDVISQLVSLLRGFQASTVFKFGLECDEDRECGCNQSLPIETFVRGQHDNQSGHLHLTGVSLNFATTATIFTTGDSRNSTKNRDQREKIVRVHRTTPFAIRQHSRSLGSLGPLVA